MINMRNAAFLLLCLSSSATVLLSQNPVSGGIPQADPKAACRSLLGMTIPAAALWPANHRGVCAVGEG